MTAADLNSCFCGCLPLKKGCIGIGVFTVVYGLIYLGLQISILAKEEMGYWPVEAVAIFSFSVVFTLLSLGFGAGLISASIKEKPCVLLAWLIYMAVHNVFLQFRTYNTLRRAHVLISSPMTLFWMCVDVTMVILFWYFMAVVYSFRKKILAGHNSTVEMNNPN